MFAQLARVVRICTVATIRHRLSIDRVLFFHTDRQNFGALFNGVLSEKIEAQPSQQKISNDKGYLNLQRGALISIANEFKKLLYVAVHILL